MCDIKFDKQNQFTGRKSFSPYIKFDCFIIFLLLTFSPTVFASDPITQIYKLGTKFQLTASRFGVSAEGIMEILENTRFYDEDVILVRSRITKMGGLMGFIIKFLRIYKESNTFDSYLNSNTLTTSRYEVYRINDDGSKKITEHFYFHRSDKRVISLQDNKTVTNNVPPDAQDAFANFLSILRMINTEELFVGKDFEIKLYSYRKVHKFNIQVTDIMLVDKTKLYTLMAKDLPPVFKYPASMEIKVSNIDEEFLFPVYGKCTIHIPLLPDVSIEARLARITDP